MSVLIGLISGALWGYSGVLSSDFWCRRCTVIREQSFTENILDAYCGPFTYLAGYHALGRPCGYNFFGNRVK